MKWMQWILGTSGASDKWSGDMMADISAALLGLSTSEHGRNHMPKG
jgi:hypothetical protein